MPAEQQDPGLGGEGRERYPSLYLAIILVLLVAAQIAFALHAPVYSILVGTAIVALSVVTLLGPLDQALLLLLPLALMRIVLPPSDRELQEVVLPIVFVLLAVRVWVSRCGKMRRIPWVAYVYFAFIIIYVFYGIEPPRGYSVVGGESTGFRARWGLFSSALVFFGALFSFRPAYAKLTLRLLRIFFTSVFLIALTMALIGIEKLPLFNTFSWSMFTETSGTTRFGILGVSALALGTLVLSDPSSYATGTRRWILFITFAGIVISGGRSALMAYLGVAVIAYAIRNGRLWQTSFAALGATFFFVLLSLSPLIESFPTSIQRVFVILPAEVYGGVAGSMGDAAAAQSSSWRTLMWGVAVAQSIEHPLEGSGFGIPVLQEDDGEEGTQDFSAYNSLVTGNLHNSYLSISYIMGFPALLAFLTWMLGLLRRLYLMISDGPATIKPWAVWLMLAIAGHLIQGFTGDVHTAMDFVLTVAFAEATLFDSALRLKGSTVL